MLKKFKLMGILILFSMSVFGQQNTNRVDLTSLTLGTEQLFVDEVDPKYANSNVYILYKNSTTISVEPKVITAGRIRFVFNKWNTVGMVALNFYINGTKVLSNKSFSGWNGIYEHTFASNNTIGVSQSATIKIEYINSQGQTNPGITSTLELRTTANKSYGKTFDFIEHFYASNSIHSKPILIVEGFDPLNNTYSAYYQKILNDVITQDLIPNGYDVFFLNFSDGGRDLRENAAVLLAAIDKVNALSTTQDNVIVAGLSMGGVISRYALSLAESINRNHHTKIFLSLDSPQEGANLSPDLQNWIASQSNSNKAIKDMQNTLKSMSAKQLLLFNKYDEMRTEHLSFFGQQYDFNGLNGDGYPHLSKNYAVSNGNLYATYGKGRNGDHILDVKTEGNIVFAATSGDLDNGPGSIMTDITYQLEGSTNLLPWWLIAEINLSYSVSINYNPVFIPTWSSLGLQNYQLNNATLNIIQPTVSKFDSCFVQETAVQHHIVSPNTRLKIKEWCNIDSWQVFVDQFNNSGQRAGIVKHWDTNTFQNIELGKPLNVPKNSTESLLAEQDVVNNNKYQNWEVSNGTTSSISLKSWIIDQDYNVKSNLKLVSSASLKTKLDGVDYSAGSVKFRDPWLIDFPDPVFANTLRNQGMTSAPFKPVASGDNNLGTSGSYKGVFKDLDPQNNVTSYYKLQSNSTETFGTQDAYFQNWSASGATIPNLTSVAEQPVVFTADNAVVTANYKGHLRTGAPELAKAINQTRLIKNEVNDSKLLVYESMGEIWLTGYSSATGWFPEYRLSSGSGTAKNPTFSNVAYLGTSSTAFIVIAFVENGRVKLQPFQPTSNWGVFYPDYLNWSSLNNVRELIDLTGETGGTLTAESRPVIHLLYSGSNGINIWWATETTSQGLVSGYWSVPFAWDGINSGTAIPLNSEFLVKKSVISSNTADQYPVLIHYPSAFGQPAKQLVYYLGTGYASGKRIVEFNVNGATKTVLSAPTGDYSYSTLSGARNYWSASYVLTATAVVPGQSTTTYNTNIYTKPTYYSGVSLSKVYTGKVNSSVSVQNMVYNGAPTYEVNLVTNSVWEKGNGGATLTQVATGVQGVFVPANVEINERPAMVTKSEPTGPSKLQFYNGTTGTLNKGEGTLYADVRSVRNYTTLSGQSKTAILDFAGALVEPVDSLENGAAICAVKLIAPDQNTIIVRQPDSIKTALAIDVIRNGVAIKSYSAGLWDELSINSFDDVQDGDVLVFRLGFPVASSWGYEIYDFNGTNLTKNGEETADAVKLKKLENGVAVYPNPFNPNTSISVSLEAPASVKVMVFNILGQLVSDFGKADLGAGVHNYAFDGKTLASGTYFYRVEIGEKVKTGKLQLLK